jgi:hypothetical protein
LRIALHLKHLRTLLSIPHGYSGKSLGYAYFMKLDALNRRNRFAGRQPTGKRIVLQERDFQCFATLERHGPLPSTYLYAFTKDTARNFKGFQQRLTDLYNEDNTPHRGFYLERPGQQFASLNARYQPMTYELTTLSRKALRDNQIPEQIFEPLSGPYLHRFMTSCLTASIELTVQTAGFRYISQAEIFTHPKCPKNVFTQNHRLALPCRSGHVIPDQLFGIDYGGSYRFFVLEADRNTESVLSKKCRANAFSKKLESYLEVLRSQSFREVWGIPSLYVMTVSTSETHLRSMMEALRGMTDARLASRFLFKVKPEFGKYWSVPEVMEDLVSMPWERVGLELSIGIP